MEIYYFSTKIWHFYEDYDIKSHCILNLDIIFFGITMEPKLLYTG